MPHSRTNCEEASPCRCSYNQPDLSGGWGHAGKQPDRRLSGLDRSKWGCFGIPRLRSVATLADQSYRTAKAVTWLRDNFKKTLNVDELASTTGMSRSTLNHHFRGLTATSPLQFQKQLRLHTARQKMLTEELDAASAAFEVGYESPGQFNREYKRFFGQPPMRDIQALRASL
jgi:AraC-like DNA-binding protein